MDEDALRERLRKRKETQELAERKKAMIASERRKEWEEFKPSIIDEKTKWENVLPKGPEIIDKIAIFDQMGYSYFLKRKVFSNQICLLQKHGKNEKDVEIVDFMEFMIADKELLFKLKARIPEFIVYIDEIDSEAES